MTPPVVFVPVWLITVLVSMGLTLILQLLAGVWWAAKLDANVKHLTEALCHLSNDAMRRHAESDAKLITHAEKQEDTLKTMWSKYDRLQDRVTIMETKVDR